MTSTIEQEVEKILQSSADSVMLNDPSFAKSRELLKQICIRMYEIGAIRERYRIIKLIEANK